MQLSCAACACREDAPGDEAADQQEINLDEHRIGADAVKAGNPCVLPALPPHNRSWRLTCLNDAGPVFCARVPESGPGSCNHPLHRRSAVRPLGGKRRAAHPGELTQPSAYLLFTRQVPVTELQRPLQNFGGKPGCPSVTEVCPCDFTEKPLLVAPHICQHLSKLRLAPCQRGL